MSEVTLGAEVVHRLKNHIAIIVGFCDLLLAEVAEDDPHRADILEVHKAAREAMALLPEATRPKGEIS
jgi:hypothetical protein